MNKNVGPFCSTPLVPLIDRLKKNSSYKFIDSRTKDDTSFFVEYNSMEIPKIKVVILGNHSYRVIS